jgi:hypothetical protein
MKIRPDVVDFRFLWGWNGEGPRAQTVGVGLIESGCERSPPIGRRRPLIDVKAWISPKVPMMPIGVISRSAFTVEGDGPIIIYSLPGACRPTGSCRRYFKKAAAGIHNWPHASRYLPSEQSGASRDHRSYGDRDGVIPGYCRRTTGRNSSLLHETSVVLSSVPAVWAVPKRRPLATEPSEFRSGTS